jgi:hypothetical protein
MAKLGHDNAVLLSWQGDANILKEVNVLDGLLDFEYGPMSFLLHNLVV